MRERTQGKWFAFAIRHGQTSLSVAPSETVNPEELVLSEVEGRSVSKGNGGAARALRDIPPSAGFLRDAGIESMNNAG